MQSTIRAARVAAGISQCELARLMGTTPGAVSQWESGRTKPGIGRLTRLASVLSVTVEELLKEAG